MNLIYFKTFKIRDWKLVINEITYFLVIILTKLSIVYGFFTM